MNPAIEKVNKSYYLVKAALNMRQFLVKNHKSGLKNVYPPFWRPPKEDVLKA